VSGIGRSRKSSSTGATTSFASFGSDNRSQSGQLGSANAGSQPPLPRQIVAAFVYTMSFPKLAAFPLHEQGKSNLHLLCRRSAVPCSLSHIEEISGQMIMIVKFQMKAGSYTMQLCWQIGSTLRPFSASFFMLREFLCRYARS